MPRVLVLQPDTLLAQTISRHLSAAGYQVRLVYGAQEALHEAEVFRPEVVVLELQLPTHNGIEFLYEFRSYTDWQNLPAVIFTSQAAFATGLGHAAWRHLNVKAYLYAPGSSLAELDTSISSVLQTEAA